MSKTTTPPQKKTAAVASAAASKKDGVGGTGRSHYTTSSRVDVEELLHRIDLAELVERLGPATLTYVRGKGEYRGRCPLHGGDNPTAFHIFQNSDGDWRWKCWAKTFRSMRI